MTKISQLPPLADTSLGPDMLFAAVAGGITQRMDSTQMRNLCKPGFFFPAHSSLTLADVGKFVVNVGGTAKLPTASGAITGQTGQWEIMVNQLFTRPQQASWTLKLLSQPTAGQSFSVYGHTFTFVSGTGLIPGDITLGAGYSDTAVNMASTLNSYGTAPGYFSASYMGSAQVNLTAKDQYAGNAGNNIYFSTGFADLSCSQNVNGQDNDLSNLNTVILQWHVDNTYNELTLGQACSASAPEGTAIGGYKWPANASEQIKNVRYALSLFSNYTNYFTDTETGSLIVNETEIPVRGSSHFSTNANLLQVNQIEDSISFLPAYVSDIVLGQLMYIHEGNALISTERVISVQLSATSNPITFSSGADLGSRALMYDDGGTVRQFSNFNDDVPSDFFNNGFVIALQEGGPGDYVWGQPFFFIGG